MSSLILGVFSLLIFVLSIPGSIALRNVLSVFLLISLVIIWFKNKTTVISLIKNNNFRNIALVLLVLTLYIFIHSMFLSHETDWSLGEFKSHWLYPMLYFIIGILLAFFTKINNSFSKELLITYLFFGMFAHVLYIDMVALEKFMQSGNLISRYGGITGSPATVNFLTNILIAMIFSEVIYRIRAKKNVLKVSNNMLLAILVFCLLSSMIEGIRFGVVSLFFLGVSATVLFLLNNDSFVKKSKWIFSIAFITLISIPIIFNAINDPRWNSLIETIPIAFDTDTNMHWSDLSKKLPKLSNGELVAGSNYLRLAWLAKSLEYIKKEPLIGIGYGRNSFGHAIQKYEGIDSARGKHSHSGILDFTISTGLIGLMLWLVFIGLIVAFSLKRFLIDSSYFALVSFFITTGFFFRSIVDSIMRDHVFQQFMLMLGIFLAFLVYEQISKTQSS